MWYLAVKSFCVLLCLTFIGAADGFRRGGPENAADVPILRGAQGRNPQTAVPKAETRRRQVGRPDEPSRVPVCSQDR